MANVSACAQRNVCSRAVIAKKGFKQMIHSSDSLRLSIFIRFQQNNDGKRDRQRGDKTSWRARTKNMREKRENREIETDRDRETWCALVYAWYGVNAGAEGPRELRGSIAALSRMARRGAM